MVANAAAALSGGAEREPETAATGPVAGRGLRSAAAGAVVLGLVVVVTETEEPHEPHDQQADVENPEADHEDPTLGGHVAMVPPIGRRVNPPAGGRRYLVAATFVGFGSPMNVAL
jgi:hypothetical protein